MQPTDPFQPLEPTPRWRLVASRLAKPYIWIPTAIVLALALGGVYYWLAHAQQTTPTNETVAIQPDSAIEKVSDKPEQKKDKKKEKEKEEKEEPTPTRPKPPKNPAKPAPSPTPPATGLVKPNHSNTGPRYSLTRTLTPNQALSELRQTGHLSRVKISGSLPLSGSDGRNWVIEDSVIVTTGRYGVQAYSSLESFTGSMAERPVLRYVEIIGSAAADGSGCNAVVYGRDIVLQHADMYGCSDIVKATHRMSIISSWLHDNDHPSGAHCDAIQIRSGTNILIRGNRLDAYVGYSSDGSQTPSGSTCSGGLQTGSVTNTISARWENNWFAGGHYTIRGWGSRDAVHSISYTFRNNKWMRHGTSVALGLTNLPANRYGPTTGSLGDFDSSNVWEDTGRPVRD